MKHQCIAGKLANKESREDTNGLYPRHTRCSEERGGRQWHECVQEHKKLHFPAFAGQLLAYELYVFILLLLHYFGGQPGDVQAKDIPAQGGADNTYKQYPPYVQPVFDLE